jgi:thioredoxin reductase
MFMRHDAIIIGGSFAGLSAAIYIARARRSVCIIDTGSPRNRFATHSHGFFTTATASWARDLRAMRMRIHGRDQEGPVAKDPQEQARLIKTLVSNSTFDRGSLSPTYVKPFDVFAKGSETGDWLLGLDSNQQPSG